MSTSTYTDRALAAAKTIVELKTLKNAIAHSQRVEGFLFGSKQDDDTILEMIENELTILQPSLKISCENYRLKRDGYTG